MTDESGWQPKETAKADANEIVGKHADDIVAAVQSVGGWQPIETAPRDGTAILVCHEDKQDREPNIVRWRGGWWDGNNEFHVYHNAAVTHWMPLPAPPEPSS